jgi:choline kinase
LLSLWCARRELARGGDVLLMDADVLFDPALLEPLVQAQGSAFLLDREFDDAGGEAVKLCVRRGAIVEFRKHVPRDLVFDFAGESVGFLRLAEPMARELAARCEHYVEAGLLDAPYEEPIRDLVLENPARFGFVDITGLPWIEIDFPRDVQRARLEILPRLAAASREGIPNAARAAVRGAMVR